MRHRGYGYASNICTQRFRHSEAETGGNTPEHRYPNPNECTNTVRIDTPITESDFEQPYEPTQTQTAYSLRCVSYSHICSTVATIAASNTRSTYTCSKGRGEGGIATPRSGIEHMYDTDLHRTHVRTRSDTQRTESYDPRHAHRTGGSGGWDRCSRGLCGCADRGWVLFF